MANSIEEKIKAYFTPILITCFGVVSWSVITEIRSDVKELLKSKAETTVEISELKRRVGNIEMTLSDKLFAIKPEDEFKVKNERTSKKTTSR